MLDNGLNAATTSWNTENASAMPATASAAWPPRRRWAPWSAGSPWSSASSRSSARAASAGAVLEEAISASLRHFNRPASL